MYRISSPNKIYDGLVGAAETNKYHPVREYLNSLIWDGKRRGETLLIDYLGAEDSLYVRTVTRKTLAAAAARIFVPGIKFDYMLVLVGRQGIGKSHILRLLGQRWYSDSINTVQGKEAYEQLQNAWIVEMAELSAIRRAEAESVKHFISKCEDIYRAAYGKSVTNFKRQCIFVGTTNESEFLKDKTGNRRFWPVEVGVCDKKKNMWTDMTREEIDQIWAEAVHIWKGGESLFLENGIEEEASLRQKKHTETSLNEGVIREYLDLPLPENWESMDIWARRRYIHGDELCKGIKGTVLRDRVCAMEVWVELLSGELKDMNPIRAREINDILRGIEGWQPYSKGTGKLRFGRIYGQQKAFIRDRSMNC